MRIRRWWDRFLGKLTVGRKNSPMSIPLVVVYSYAGTPEPHPVKEVDREGAFVVTKDTWYPGTIVTMVFQYDPNYLQVVQIAGNPKAALEMRAKLMRFEPDGVGVRFLYLNKQERRRFKSFLEGAEVRGAV